ncbi:DUF1905 domain-containing protein [Microterricola viridarii]|uniref:DUF1905 domain-containing protein n=1 Tax=Microterricola viridarii TaxID=412690 RepID=A0A1H1Y7W9_9MICO|nr:DUF1905 domain-containing protein [Microterricola viridarii]SDT17106.1 protein of unknown function [Microterricola viridarii]
MRFEFTSPLWEWSSQGASWFFVTLPEEASEDLREIPRMPRGFGAIKVRVTVGGTSWLTSVFPDSRTGGHWLPIKKAVRVAEGLEDGEPVQVSLELVEL